MKKYVSILISMLMFFSICQTGMASGGLKWEDYYDTTSNYNIDFVPYDNDKCQQNSPLFLWPYIKEADSYELIVCRDRELSDIAYQKEGIKTTSFIFSYTLEPGTYYWAVRFFTASGASEYCTARRFTILEDYIEFTLPKMSEVIARLTQQSHPRLLFNADNLEFYRGLAAGELKDYFDTLYQSAQNYVKNVVIEEPETGSAAYSRALNFESAMQTCGFVYLMTGDKEIGEYAKNTLVSVAKWDLNGTSGWVADDRPTRILTSNMGIGYDWLYDLLSASERQTVLKGMRERCIYEEHPPAGLQDAPYMLETMMYASHGWGHAQGLLLSALATVGEIPESDLWIEKYLPIFIGRYPLYSIEDGGWNQGMGYFLYSNENITGLLPQVVKSVGINLFEKAWFQNYWKYFLYTMDTNLTMEAGDESYGTAPNSSAKTMLEACIAGNGSEYANWLYQKLGADASKSMLGFVRFADYKRIGSKMPADLPRAHLFQGIGTVAMHSDLINDDSKISCYFRSSQYGSNNHAHPDQNSFVIQAYGERLAIDSGYYDYYWSAFDKGYTKKTYAHNAITYNGGKGQGYAYRNAKGKIVNFLTHPDFDLVSGDAAQAYNWHEKYNQNLDKAKRSMIYIRPDTFIVIDDLKATGTKKVDFEWWLNAYEDISLYDSGTGARIVKGNASLDAKVHYPGVTGYYSDIFSGPDLNPLMPSGTFANKPVHKRVWFETEPVNETRMVSTMNVHSARDEAPYVGTETENSVMKLVFEDGTVAFVRLNDEVTIDTGRYQTDAVALVVKDESIMMVDGTYVMSRENTLIASEKTASVVMGDNELGISMAEDGKLRIACGTVTAVSDSEGKQLAENTEKDGMTWHWNQETGKLEISALDGFYSWFLNDKPLPGAKTDSQTITVRINGAPHLVAMNGYLDHNGNSALSGNLPNKGGFFRIDEVQDVNVANHSRAGDTVFLSPNAGITSSGGGAFLVLTDLTDTVYQGDTDTYYADVYEKLDIRKEAEDYTAFRCTSGGAYSSATALPSKSALQIINAPGETVTWTVEVLEEGDYSFVMKYAGWDGADGLSKILQIGDEYRSLNSKQTGGYGRNDFEWLAAVYPVKMHLTAGTHTVTLHSVDGNANIDWFGFIKEE